MFKEYKFIRLDWSSTEQMSTALNDALESLDIGRDPDIQRPFEVVNVSALSEEVLVLVASETHDE